MKIIHHLNDLSNFSHPVSLTIGNFDGVHLGHQALLKHLVHTARAKNGHSLAITFKDHPQNVLYKKNQASICTLAHKCKLLEEAGVDILLLLPFTAEFAEQTAEVFLEKIHAKFPFSHLILGEDALFGKDRHATKEYVATLGNRFHFSTEYMKLLTLNEKTVSSSYLRTLIQKGDFVELKTFLGRDYSIYGQIIKGEGKGKALGFPTANLDVSNLILPPLGVYAMTAYFDGKPHPAIANLGIAPTLRQKKTVRLEIHLLNSKESLYEKYVDALFSKFIREEKRFSSALELQKQIRLDIEAASS